MRAEPLAPGAPAAFDLSQVALDFDPALGDTLRPSAGRDAAATGGSVGSRYRLVGVMSGRGSAGGNLTAIIEARASGTQCRVRAGDRLEPLVKVTVVKRDEVWVRGPGGEECLMKDRRGAVGTIAGATGGGAGEEASGGTAAARFGGKQTAEDQWQFSRDAIMSYYRELLDQPERLVKVFDSLAPVYTEAHTISGYRVNIEGEADFFDAVGLRQDDVVRKVNGIEMTNRRRAENLIRRFAQQGLDTVVIELERGGQPVKQTYETH
ncbi:MAG: hypothetical protein PHR35_18230 [Kiritimatiellae bacterium]|nr:hypothetical protein [Kiritimatiellia bacterium]